MTKPQARMQLESIVRHFGMSTTVLMLSELLGLWSEDDAMDESNQVMLKQCSEKLEDVAREI